MSGTGRSLRIHSISEGVRLRVDIENDRSEGKVRGCGVERSVIFFNNFHKCFNFLLR